MITLRASRQRYPLLLPSAFPPPPKRLRRRTRLLPRTSRLQRNRQSLQPPLLTAQAVIAPTGLPPRARSYYEMLWGVDSFGAKSVESGEMIRFSYRVLDPDKAAQLNDKHNQPALIDERAGVKLSVPTLEKVGALRQSSNPEAGKVCEAWPPRERGERHASRRQSFVI